MKIWKTKIVKKKYTDGYVRISEEEEADEQVVEEFNGISCA